MPPGATVVGIPARQVGPQPAADGALLPGLRHRRPASTIDPVSRAIDRLTEQVEELSARVAELERQTEQAPESPGEERRVAAS